MAVDEHGQRDIGGLVLDDDVEERGTTSGRAWSECGATNVTAIASSPQTSTGPPFERLYAVEPDGRRADHPVARLRPEVLAADRPLELDHPAERRLRDDDVVDGGAALVAGSTASVGSSTTSIVAGEGAREPGSSSSVGDRGRKPTRPKLTPSTGTPVPRKRCSARSIVPSPPSTTTMSAARRPPSSTTCFSRLVGGSSSTPRRSTAAALERRPIVSGLPCVTTPRRGRLNRRHRRSSRRAHRGALGLLALDEVEEELPVSLRAGQARVYDRRRSRPPSASAASATSRSTRRRDVRVADDAARPTSSRPASNCGLRARAPASRARRARAPAAAPCGRR